MKVYIVFSQNGKISDIVQGVFASLEDAIKSFDDGMMKLYDKGDGTWSLDNWYDCYGYDIEEHEIEVYKDSPRLLMEN